MPRSHCAACSPSRCGTSRRQRLFCARDRFGIKPFYYTVVRQSLYICVRGQGTAAVCAGDRNRSGRARRISDLPVHDRRSDPVPRHQAAAAGACADRRKWRRPQPGAIGTSITRSTATTARDISPAGSSSCSTNSIGLHMRSDVPVGAYVSGGIDSSLIAILAAKTEARDRRLLSRPLHRIPGLRRERLRGVRGRRAGSQAAHASTSRAGDFRDHIGDVIYHLDFPVAGPGSFPQFMVSQLAARHVKVVLGGQGGDEIFGGYARYLLAYFEQCIKAAHRRHLQERQFRRHRSNRSCPTSACCASTSR